MFSKSLALAAVFAAFAAFVPAFASPTPNELSPVEMNIGRSLIGVGVDVNNILNNATVKVLSTRDNYGCSTAEIRAVVTSVARNADPEDLSVRSACNARAIAPAAASAIEDIYLRTLGMVSKRSTACSIADISAAVYNVANDMDVKVLSEKRSSCDQVTLNAVVKDTLEDLNVSVLSEREEYSLSSFMESL